MKERRLKKTKARQKREKTQMFRHLALWFFVVFGFLGAVFGLLKFVSRPPAVSDLTASLVRAGDWFKGQPDSSAVLIEYSDFQCPACANYFPLLKQLNEEFQNELRFVYRHFPLSQIHKNARLAAWAAEVAGRQNKFWEMHDLIFERQMDWADQEAAPGIFVNYARQLNLDPEKFEKDLNSEEIKEKVDKDYQSGLSLRVKATPTFFLNGEKIQNPRKYEDFRKLINEVVKN